MTVLTIEKADMARAICEIRCVCTLLTPEDRPGAICADMAENIIRVFMHQVAEEAI